MANPVEYPVLLPSNTWFKSTTKTRPDFTIIRIVDSYTPTGKETERWNADVGDSGAIECYVVGTELIIAGNGSGMIAANEDSSFLFSAAVSTPANIQTFKNVTHIYGAELLDMSKVEALNRALAYALSLEYIEVGNWNVANVKTLEYFSGAPDLVDVGGVIYQVGGIKLKNLNVGKWNVGNVTTFKNAFLGCKMLTKLDVGDWDVSSATSFYGMCRDCTSLVDFDTSKWKAPNVADMSAMLANCENIRVADFGALDNSKTTEAKMVSAFLGMIRLERIKINSKFKLGNGYPSGPSDQYIEGADGRWHTIGGASYAAKDMPDNVNITYYASTRLAAKVREIPVLVPGEIMTDIANAVRGKTGGIGDLKPSEIATALRGV